MDQLIRFLVVFILLVPALFGFFIVINVLFPKRVTKTLTVLHHTPARVFWIGLVNIVFLLPISMLLFSLADITTGPLKWIITLPALFFLAVLLGLASFGLSSVVNMVGERVTPEQSLLKRTFWSTLLLCLASALPLVGWFLLLPYLLAIGIGGVILGFFQKDS